eukprot:UN17589
MLYSVFYYVVLHMVPFWPLLPSICTDLWGVETLGQNYNFLNFAPIAGSLTLSVLISGKIYDHHAEKQHNPDSNQCYGTECYQWAF